MEEELKRLQDYFDKIPSVILAFLFGSRAGNFYRKSSDWDIGIYVRSEERLELETEIDYPEEWKIWSDLIDILKTDNVDLVILNRAGPPLVYDVLRKGLPIVVKDRGLYLDLLCKTSYEAMDWWEFVEEYYRISERASSIPPAERARILRYLKFLESEFSELDKIKAISWEDYLNDSFKRKVIERWIENIVMAMLDIAKIILASDKKQIPETYKEILKNFGIFYFNQDFGEKIAWFAIMRNIIVHEYLDIRWKRIKKFLGDGETLIPVFIKGVKDILKE